MRNFDLAPLYRATVGFDQIADLMDRVSAAEQGKTYPPYNIERTGEDGWRITLAVAGFGTGDLSIEVRENLLVVAAKRADDAEEGRTYLHRGIATRAFERRFTLAQHVQVTGARTENGLLEIDLVREVPEALKPRRIEIASGARPQAIEAKGEEVEA
jgi:molecular chaperone IbpA